MVAQMLKRWINPDYLGTWYLLNMVALLTYPILRISPLTPWLLPDAPEGLQSVGIGEGQHTDGVQCDRQGMIRVTGPLCDPSCF